MKPLYIWGIALVCCIIGVIVSTSYMEYYTEGSFGYKMLSGIGLLSIIGTPLTTLNMSLNLVDEIGRWKNEK